MKKTFLLTDTKKDSQRVLDSIKNNIRKYIYKEKIYQKVQTFGKLIVNLVILKRMPLILNLKIL